MAVSVGAGGLTVNVWAPLVPPAVVTVTSRPPSAAPLPIVKSAVSDVALTTLTLLTVTSDPPTATVVPPAMKFVPVSVTATVFPCTPEAGLSAVSVGVCGLTVNVCVPLVPLAVVTLTVRSPMAASTATTKFAVNYHH